MGFRDSTEVVKYIGGIFETAFEDAEIQTKLVASGLVFAFDFYRSGSDRGRRRGEQRSMTPSRGTPEPMATMKMPADTGNAYWQGKVNLPAGDGQEDRRWGNVASLLKLARSARSCSVYINLKMTAAVTSWSGPGPTAVMARSGLRPHPHRRSIDRTTTDRRTNGCFQEFCTPLRIGSPAIIMAGQWPESPPTENWRIVQRHSPGQSHDQGSAQGRCDRGLSDNSAGSWRSTGPQSVRACTSPRSTGVSRSAALYRRRQ